METTSSRFLRLFGAIERACWHGRTLNRANVARAYDSVEALSLHEGNTEVGRTCAALVRMNREMARTGHEYRSDGNCAPYRANGGK